MNGDMFCDYFQSVGKEPDEADKKLFKAARAIFDAQREAKVQSFELERLERVKRLKKRSRKYVKKSDYWVKKEVMWNDQTTNSRKTNR
ncbi:hypothetical protein [Gordonia sp. CNJ-863]|uniref:hypothetical protein n=1 Tax=Gordonia sp. CNJ-863 TaxID=1904963 RepID=UPI00111510C0|nr:hypothetical protein [Gordonia sp. CNJ-863]